MVPLVYISIAKVVSSAPDRDVSGSLKPLMDISITLSTWLSRHTTSTEPLPSRNSVDRKASSTSFENWCLISSSRKVIRAPDVLIQ